MSAARQLRVVIPGQPKAWQRAGQRRVELADGRSFTRTFTPRPMQRREDWIRGKAERAMEAQGWTTTDKPVSLSIEVILARPKKSLRVYADRRPDLDNYEKAVLDAFSRARVYTDDARVVRKIAEKRYARSGEPPQTIVDVELL